MPDPYFQVGEDIFPEQKFESYELVSLFPRQKNL